MTSHLSVVDAAKRVKRSVRTIETWINEGPEADRLPVVRVGRKRFVEQDALLAIYRKKLGANPNRPRTNDNQ